MLQKTVIYYKFIHKELTINKGREMRNIFLKGLLIFIITGISAGHSIVADDWPIWRGPNKNGISEETNWNPKGISKVLWEKNVGAGWSAFSVKGKRAYTMGNSGGEDHIYCLDTETGKEIWKYSYSCSKGGGYAGPRASPVIKNDCVYSFSVDSEVHCVDAKKGKKKWSTNLSDLGARNITWKYSSSPVLTKKLVLINAGSHGIALDKQTGKKVWSTSGIGGYATPVLLKKGRKKRVIIFGEKDLCAVSLKSGKKFWSFPWQTKYNVNAADPLVNKKWIFISSGYGRGCALLNVKGKTPKLIWENTNLCNHFSSSIYVDGYIYGVDGNIGRGKLTCIDIKNGDVKWRENLGFGSLMIAGDKIIYMGERGTLTIGKFSPDGFSKIASERVLKGAGKCWTTPVLSNGRIFCRGSNGKTVCLDVSK